MTSNRKQKKEKSRFAGLGQQDVKVVRLRMDSDKSNPFTNLAGFLSIRECSTEQDWEKHLTQAQLCFLNFFSTKVVSSYSI